MISDSRRQFHPPLTNCCLSSQKNWYSSSSPFWNWNMLGGSTSIFLRHCHERYIITPSWESELEREREHESLESWSLSNLINLCATPLIPSGRIFNFIFSSFFLSFSGHDTFRVWPSNLYSSTFLIFWYFFLVFFPLETRESFFLSRRHNK